MTVIYVILLFVLMIFPHELGHFIAAKACRVQVNEFAFGMGPALFKKQGRETLYSVRAVPVGGYCAMEGEDTEEASDNPRAFNNKKWWQKIIILVAGAAMNVLIAVLALTIISAVYGMTTTVIEEVSGGSPAMEAGIEAGDEVIAVGGERVESWSDVGTYIAENIESDGSVDITVAGDSGERTVTVLPEETDGRLTVGITCKVSHNVFRAIVNGATGAWDMTVMMVDAFKQLFASGDFVNQVSGPVGIVSAVSETTTYGGVYYVYLVALISLNLAFINLLPFPALDGGRIIFVIIRLITGKAITDKMEGTVHMIGMMCLLGLFVFVTWNDITRLFQ